MTDFRVELRLRRVGNSLGVILPRQALDALGVEAKPGEMLALVRRADSGLELRHEDAEFARKLALLRETLRQNRNALGALTS